MNVLNDFKDHLLEATKKVYHYEVPKNTTLPYVVWQETGGRYFYGDNSGVESVVKVQIDIFSEDEFEPLVDEVISVLNSYDVAVSYPIFDYDTELKVTRAIIECEVV